MDEQFDYLQLDSLIRPIVQEIFAEYKKQIDMKVRPVDVCRKDVLALSNRYDKDYRLMKEIPKI